jgi:NDT80 / PhoG like DNA-binding  family
MANLSSTTFGQAVKGSSISLPREQFNPFTSPEGPSFSDTHVIYYPSTSQGGLLQPEINASIQKGFFRMNGNWTCYRRNYFTVACSFDLGNEPIDKDLYLKTDHNDHLEYIQHFAVSISAKTVLAANNKESETRGLVQHTPKRSRESVAVPTKEVVVPSTPGLQNDCAYNYQSNIDTFAQSQSHPPSYTFERIQFQRATANNGKRRDRQQYFYVVAELYAGVRREYGTEWILIANKDSAPMVVRGRSPAHYKDIRSRAEDGMGWDFYGNLSCSPTPPARPSIHLVDEKSLNGVPTGPITQNFGASIYPQQNKRGSTDQMTGTLAIDQINLTSSTGAGAEQGAKVPDDEKERPMILDNFVVSRTTHATKIDAFSDSSVSSDTGHLSKKTISSSATSAADPSSPLDDIVTNLLHDNGIKNLCNDGFSELGEDRFEHNLRRLLKHFANDLRRRAKNDDEITAAAFFRRRSVNAARLVREACLQQKVADEEPLSLPPWSLNERSNEDMSGLLVPDQEMDETLGDDDEDEDLLGLGPEEGLNGNFWALKNFFVRGDAFEDFREGLIDFVAPRMVRIHQARHKVSDSGIAIYLQQRYERKRPITIPSSGNASSRNAQLPSSADITASRLAGLRIFAFTFMQAGLRASRRYFRPKLQLGLYRAEWICECGEELWADFSHGQTWPLDSEPMYIQAACVFPYLRTLPAQAPIPSSSAGSTILQDAALTALEAHRGGAAARASSRPANSTHLDLIGSGTSSTRYRVVPMLGCKFLELCINTGEYEINLAEIKIEDHGLPAIRSDGELFRAIKNQYEATRFCLLTHKLRVFKPARVDYVEVSWPRKVAPDSDKSDNMLLIHSVLCRG